MAVIVEMYKYVHYKGCFIVEDNIDNTECKQSKS